MTEEHKNELPKVSLTNAEFADAPWKEMGSSKGNHSEGLLVSALATCGSCGETWNTRKKRKDELLLSGNFVPGTEGYIIFCPQCNLRDEVVRNEIQ